MYDGIYRKFHIFLMVKFINKILVLQKKTSASSSQLFFILFFFLSRSQSGDICRFSIKFSIFIRFTLD